MTDYTYSRVAALNFNTTPPTVGKSATGSVYAIGDTGFTTALNVTFVVGGSTSTTISSDANGFFPDFTVANRTSVVFKQNASSFTGVLTTTDPVPGPTGATGAAGATGAQGPRGDLASWQPSTFYPLNQVVSRPDGVLMRVTTAHTSGASYDASKFAEAVADRLLDASLNATFGPAATQMTSAFGPTATGLVAAFAPIIGVRPGGRWVALGDSITYGGTDNVNQAIGESWPTYASLMSQSRVRLVRNAGVPGNTTAQMLSRFDADVTPYTPSLVTIAGGTNDYANSVTFATFKANIAALVAKVRTIGAVPILCTIPPRNTDYHTTISTWNTWLRDYAEKNGFTILDMYRTLVDPANGNYLAAYYSDGVHPNGAGAAAMGETAGWVLSSLTPGGGPLLPVDSTDANNLLGSAGLFLTAQGSGVGTGWTPGSAPSNTVKSVITDANVVGGTQRITMTTASGLWEQYIDVTTGFTVGDKLRAVGVASSDGGGGADVQIKVNFTGASASAKSLNNIAQAFTRGVYCQDVTIPAGTTAIRYSLICGAVSAACVVDFAQIGLYNLTAMGI